MTNYHRMPNIKDANPSPAHRAKRFEKEDQFLHEHAGFGARLLHRVSNLFSGR